MNERAELVAVTDARARLNELLTQVLPERDVVLLRHSRAAAVMLAPERYDALLERIEELEAEMTALAVRAGLEPTESWKDVRPGSDQVAAQTT